MSKPKVYVTRQLFDEAIQLLKKHADVEVYEGIDDSIPRDLLLSKVEEAEGLLCLLTERIDEEVLNRAHSLKVVSNYAVGFNNIDVKKATERGIYVTNTPGILTETTADCAFTLLLSLARRIPEADRFVKEGRWVHSWGPRMFLGSDIYGKTLGIIGLGRIGYAVLKRAEGFDMSLIYYDAVRRRDIEDKHGIVFKSFEEVLSESDFISIHVPLTEETHHMISKKQLSSMKRKAYLINTSRGQVVDEKSLIWALKNNIISGAALDVFEEEPLDPKSDLITFQNVVLTPHIASASVETRTKMALVAAKNLTCVLQGKMPPNLVNQEVKNVRPLKE